MISEASDERKTRKTVLPRARMSGKLRFFDENSRRELRKLQVFDKNSRRELRTCRFLMKIAVGSSETAGF